MPGWRDNIKFSHVKGEDYYRERGRKTNVLEVITILYPDPFGDQRRRYRLKPKNETISYNLRQFNSAMGFLEQVHRKPFVTVRRYKQQGEMVEVHDHNYGVNFPETPKGHKQEFEYTIRAIQTIFVAQGLGGMIGIRPDQERRYLERMPFRYSDLLTKAKRGNQKAKQKLIAIMAEDRQAAMHALERVQSLYWFRYQEIKWPWTKRMTYRELNRYARKMHNHFDYSGTKRKLRAAGLAYILGKRKARLAIRKP